MIDKYFVDGKIKNVKLRKRQIITVEVGKKVRSIDAIYRSPAFVLMETGLTGVITEIEHAHIYVKLDKHFEELNEWDNDVACPYTQENDGTNWFFLEFELID